MTSIPAPISVTAISIAALLAVSVPAAATGTIGCTGFNGTDTELVLTIATGPVPDVVSVQARAGGAAFSTTAEPGATPVFVAQDYDDGTELRVDLADEAFTALVLSIRIVRVEQKSGPFQIGYLSVEGDRAYGVTCEGP